MFINKAEENFDLQIKAVTRDILAEKNCRFVLLSGPSSSGKTTTAAKIVKNLKENGREAYRVSLDDFYFNRDDIPLTKSGAKDYETVSALDIDLIKKVFNDLDTKKEADLPIFDFATGKRKTETNHIVLNENDMLVVEGIHALNPLITNGIDENLMYKAYVSVSSRVLNEKGEVVFSKRNLRLLRRIIRDFHHRNSSVENTLKQWGEVLRGEDNYIFPFEINARRKIDSFHAYEISFFKEEAISLIKTVDKSSPFFYKASELLESLNMIDSINGYELPEKSLLREFSE